MASIEARYAEASSIHAAVTTEAGLPGETFSKCPASTDTSLAGLGAADLHRPDVRHVPGHLHLCVGAHGLDRVGGGLAGGQVQGGLPAGDLRDLLTDGVIAGVGAVLVFLPQILLLFLFIGLLEDTGYMARAAFLMDRLMSRVGLHGKSFIPLLSSFACAIPGIMATRTIETPKDRLVTILVAPLMSCSARLPVYTILIAACIPNIAVLGFMELLGPCTMLGMYLLGIVVALAMAWLFKRTLLKGHAPMLIMELPPYKRPSLRTVARHVGSLDAVRQKGRNRDPGDQHGSLGPGHLPAKHPG